MKMNPCIAHNEHSSTLPEQFARTKIKQYEQIKVTLFTKQ